MGGLLSKENEQQNTGFIESVKGKIKVVRNKLGIYKKSQDPPQQPPQQPSQQPPQQPSQQPSQDPSQDPSQQPSQQPIPMSGGRRKSKRNISKKRRLKKLKKLKKAKKSLKNNRK